MIRPGACKNCGYDDNGWAKRSCARCGKILEGPAINNVTGSIGYRNADGSFLTTGYENTADIPVPLPDKP
jgi:hypothetical protein